MPKRPVNIYILALVLSVIFGCQRDKRLLVEPISLELNQEFLTGKGLDTNYFSTSDVMQYYQVSNSKSMPDKQIFTTLDSFARTTFPIAKLKGIKQLTLLFYQKRWFIDYSDHLYEDARENDTRRLEEHSDKLMATITFERTKENPKKLLFSRLLYGKNNIRTIAKDTLTLP